MPFDVPDIRHARPAVPLVDDATTRVVELSSCHPNWMDRMTVDPHAPRSQEGGTGE